MHFRRELLEQLNDVQPNVELESPDNVELEEGEISSNSICESHSIFSKDDDFKSTNTSHLTLTSEESEEKLSKKRNKKKLKVVTNLEKKVLKTPVKKYPKEKNKQKKNVDDKRNEAELDTKIDKNKKLFLLFDEIDEVTTRRSDTNSDKTENVKPNPSKKVNVENNKKSKKDTVNKTKTESENLLKENLVIENDEGVKNVREMGVPLETKPVCEKKTDQRRNSRMLLDAMLPSLDEIQRDVKHKITDRSKESIAVSVEEHIINRNNIENHSLAVSETINDNVKTSSIKVTLDCQVSREKQMEMDRGKYKLLKWLFFFRERMNK